MAETRECVEGIVDRVVFVAAGGYTVVRLAGARDEPVTATGVLLRGTQPGESLRLWGRWERHSQHGVRFVVADCERVRPVGVHAIQCFLSSGLIRGIGPRLAEAIVGVHGDRTLKMIDTDPDQLLRVHNIGPGRVARIVQAWGEHKAVHEVMVFLHGLGASPALAVRIHQALGEDAIQVVRTQPYRLVEEVRGIGFLTADPIAMAVGIPENSHERLRAGLLHVLDTAEQRGHCYLTEQRLLEDATKLLGQDDDMLLRPALDSLRADRRVVVEVVPTRTGDGLVVFSARMHRAETDVATDIARLATADSGMPPALARILGGTLPVPDGQELEPGQDQAVRTALTHTVSIVTGGPGCGKSFTVRTLVATVKAAGARVALAAPTGRAARRLEELTGTRATTVHRLLARPRDADPVTLFDDSDVLASADLIVVDEASMLDVRLAAKLLDRVPTGAHLVLVGDVDQLPSVGPGNVLRDLLALPEIPRVRLSHVFRQAAGSSIITNAHLIRRGEAPVNEGQFWFLPENDPARIPDLVVDIATRRLPAKFGIDVDQVQVLSPKRRSPIGAIELGRRIQDVVNPTSEGIAEHWSDSRVFRIGDKVTQIRNDYHKGEHGVFNGTTGIVTTLHPADRLLDVALEDGRTVSYGYDELDDLLHAYAITVHRAQGSEYPYVVVPLVKADAFFLRRNLVYTAVTRARQMVVLVGQPEALEMAITRPGDPRHTNLTRRLGQALGHHVETSARP
ncbi:ATP-dependent RecD-like DNA helicase [Embleya sp. NBC_00896]|uniref:SF1B family DNA helicase RecD2 n=1 Tax=Embleya sp. NBC_00896 TaxID=2975961 RepID=UPI003866DDFA|nr:ATP-dependent RecD-like DNA helicase [Embleya sp. NBC_00896]